VKLTPWFSPDEKPVRDGVWEVDWNGPGWYRVYSHGRWYVGGDSVDSAWVRYQDKRPSMLDLCWRGLAEEPKR